MGMKLHHMMQGSLAKSWLESSSADLPADHSTRSHYSPILQKVVLSLLLTFQDIKIRKKLILTEINYKHQGGLLKGGTGVLP